MRRLGPAVEQAFLAACRAELEALKPGNVHAFAEGHRMTVSDFEASAKAAAAPIGRPRTTTGRRILDAVAATRAAVGQNTNLGIVLLCAPLSTAAEKTGTTNLRQSLAKVLAKLDREDARLAFEAIRMARPAGLGEAARHDVRDPPSVTLRVAMAEAAARDRIARAYVDDFSEIFELGLPALEAASVIARPSWWPATATFLAFLRSEPDSHVRRKFGDAAAENLRLEAEAVSGRLGGDCAEADRIAELESFDRSLKERGINPGTCADLTVATLFAARLDGILREGRESGSLAPGGERTSLLSGQPVRRQAGR